MGLQKIDNKPKLSKSASLIFIALGTAGFIFSTYIGQWLHKWIFQ